MDIFQDRRFDENKWEAKKRTFIINLNELTNERRACRFIKWVKWDLKFSKIKANLRKSFTSKKSWLA